MKNNISLILIIFFFYACNASFALTSEVIFLDTRLLVLAHPLYKSFDSKINRFKGTSSEPIKGGYEGVNAEIERIKLKQDELLKSPVALKKELKKIPLVDRIKAERLYLKNKKRIESELQEEKMRIYNARMFPTLMGMTLDTSIIPQINRIVYDIRAVTRELKTKYKAKTIIDVAAFFPYRSEPKIISELLKLNLHATTLFSNNNYNKVKAVRWLREATSYWASKMGVDSMIIPYGARDVRLESIKMLETRTGAK